MWRLVGCAWAVPGRYLNVTAPFRCWEDGEKCARNRAVQIRVVVSREGGIERVRVKRKLLRLVLSRRAARDFFLSILLNSLGATRTVRIFAHRLSSSTLLSTAGLADLRRACLPWQTEF